MLRYKTETRPGLVALYDIRPGNGAGQFLQPRSPHGAIPFRKHSEKVTVPSVLWHCWLGDKIPHQQSPKVVRDTSGDPA